MNKVEAHTLLNAAAGGAVVSRHQITAALIVTGDLLPVKRVVRPSLPSEVLSTDVVPVWEAPKRFLPVVTETYKGKRYAREVAA